MLIKWNVTSLGRTPPWKHPHRGGDLFTVPQQDTVQELEEGEVVDDVEEKVEVSDNIIICCQDSVSSWDSIEDSGLDASSELIRQMAVDEILEHGMTYTLPSWMRQTRPPALQLFSEEMLKRWPKVDKKCRVRCEEGWPISKWTQEVNMGHVSIIGHSTVLCLPRLKQMESMEPIKNKLGQLCRALRSIDPQGKIYICSNIPGPFGAPVLGARTLAHNQLLEMAVKGINANLFKVFYVDIARYFSRDGQTGIAEFFHNNTELNYLGCLRFRALLFREVGLTAYAMWDDDGQEN